jgi:N-acetylmuramoyl-L-alanine amidase
MFTISEHRLSGPNVIYNGTGNFSANRLIAPQYLVIHYTVVDYAGAIRAFGPAGPQNASAHLVVSRTGETTQMVDFNRRAWHAGTSSWAGLQDMNSHSIGIELENHGYLRKKADGTFVSDNNRLVPPDQVIEATHKNRACTARFWHQYSPEQLDICEQLASALTTAYGLKDVIGHEDIAPDRKVDPGPAFPLDRMQTAALGRDAEITETRQFTVATPKLNIRTGPGTSYSLAGLPLTQGTKLSQLQTREDGWIQVAVLAPGGMQGWVYGAYLS